MTYLVAYIPSEPGIWRYIGGAGTPGQAWGPRQFADEWTCPDEARAMRDALRAERPRAGTVEVVREMSFEPRQHAVEEDAAP